MSKGKGEYSKRKFVYTGLGERIYMSLFLRVIYESP